MSRSSCWSTMPCGPAPGSRSSTAWACPPRSRSCWARPRQAWRASPASARWRVLYRMGVPSEIEVVLASTEEALERLTEWERDPRVGILVAGDIDTLAALTVNRHPVSRVNVGGLHHRPGRSERLRYVYLSDAEASQLRTLAARGVEVTAQDVPTTPPVPLEDFT